MKFLVVLTLSFMILTSYATNSEDLSRGLATLSTLEQASAATAHGVRFFSGVVVGRKGEEAILEQAKKEQRVIRIGEYCRHRKAGICTERRKVYCVFADKLATIIQWQGRWEQLHLSFGTSHDPHCEGLTVEQLQQLDFSKIDFSKLIEDFQQQIIDSELQQKMLRQSNDYW